MTVAIDAAVEEMYLLQEEFNSMINHLNDTENPMPLYYQMKASIRHSVLEQSLNYIEAFIIMELLEVPIELFYATPANNGE